MEIRIRIDRRAEVVDALYEELESLAETVQGLEVEIVDRHAVEAARDAGKFRDFVDVALVRHVEREVVEWVAEELIDEFGWLVDIAR